LHTKADQAQRPFVAGDAPQLDGEVHLRVGRDAGVARHARLGRRGDETGGDEDFRRRAALSTQRLPHPLGLAREGAHV
jgi:hypothetical protein